MEKHQVGWIIWDKQNNEDWFGEVFTKLVYAQDFIDRFITPEDRKYAKLVPVYVFKEDTE